MRPMQGYIVLIPLLVDVPLWEADSHSDAYSIVVLIPLLVDVPLWVLFLVYLHLLST